MGKIAYKNSRLYLLFTFAIGIAAMIFCLIWLFFVVINFFDEYQETNDFGRFFSLVIHLILILFINTILVVIAIFIKRRYIALESAKIE